MNDKNIDIRIPLKEDVEEMQNWSVHQIIMERVYWKLHTCEKH